MTQTLAQELLVREADGIEVSLLWWRQTDTLAVVVNDERLGESFEVAAPCEKALDVFYHPFAYAAAQGVSYSIAA